MKKMRVFVVLENVSGENLRVFSTYDKARNFILESYKNCIAYFGKEKLVGWITPEEAEEYFEKVSGIEDFMYVVDTKFDSNSPIDWSGLFVDLD